MNLRILRTFLAVVVVAGVVLLRAASAQAALMHSYDIDSLAFSAQEIVLVTKVKAWEDKPNYRTFETVRVKKSYAGSALRVGDQFDLDTSCYGLAPVYGWGQREDGTPKTRTVSDDRVVFLQALKRDAAQPVDTTPRLDWQLVASGMRIFVDGQVHAFVQENNPGCYGPTPGEGPTGAPYGLAAFEVALRAAIAQATTAHSLLAQSPSVDRTNKLLAIAGPAPDAPRAVRSTPHERDRDFGRDQIGGEILKAFGKEGNLEALLDARVRVTRFDNFALQHGISAERLVAAARDSQQLLSRRLAALGLLEGMSFEVSEKPLGPAFAALLTDPAPAIRRATLDIWFTQGKTPREFKEAILQRYPIEPDGNVRFALFQRARREGLFERLTTKASEMPLAMYKLDRETLTVEWTTIDTSSGPGFAEDVVLELRKAKAVVSREVVPPALYGTSASSESGGIHLPLSVPASVAPGTYDVRVTVSIKSGKGGAPVSRTLDVGPVELGPRPPKPRADLTPAPSESAVATAAAPASSDPPSPAVTRAAGEDVRRVARDKGPAIAAGVVLAIGLDFVRRRRRRK